MSGEADDAHAIQSLKARYCHAVDSAAHDRAGAQVALGAIFLPDAVGDYGYGPVVGGVAMGSFLCGSIADNSAWALHAVHTPLIVIDGDTATADWTVTVRLKRRAGGQVDVVAGRYANVLRRTPDGWRIAQIRFTQLD